MTFADYVKVLKKHFKKKISNEDICGILFDAIILPLNLKNRNGEDFIIDKAEVSRIMNGKKKIPTALQEHVWDKPILDNIIEYFETNIVSELVPDKSDLCHQMMNLIESDKNISPAHKAALRLSATQKSISLFLAEGFIFTINQDINSTPPKIEDSSNMSYTKPILKIYGITAGNELSETVEARRFHPRQELTLNEYKNRIRLLYEDIAKFQIADDNNFCQRYHRLIECMNLSSVPVKINEQDIAMIKSFAEEIGFTLTENFFFVGNLRRDFPRFNLEFTKIYGDERGKIKYDKIKSLLKNIESYRKLKPIDNAFEHIFFIRIALRNIGQTFDENINVRLIIDKNSLFTSNCLEEYLLKDILDHFNDIFTIKRNKNYFEYDNQKTYTSRLNRIPLFDSDRNLVEEWNELFPYFISTEDQFIILEIDFEKILQNTTISFPTVILLKKLIPCIKYEIRSKFIPEIITGVINLA